MGKGIANNEIAFYNNSGKIAVFNTKTKTQPKHFNLGAKFNNLILLKDSFIVFPESKDCQRIVSLNKNTQEQRWAKHFPKQVYLIANNEKIIVLKKKSPNATLYVVGVEDGNFKKFENSNLCSYTKNAAIIIRDKKFVECIGGDLEVKLQSELPCEISNKIILNRFKEQNTFLESFNAFRKSYEPPEDIQGSKDFKIYTLENAKKLSIYDLLAKTKTSINIDDSSRIVILNNIIATQPPANYSYSQTVTYYKLEKQTTKPKNKVASLIHYDESESSSTKNEPPKSIQDLQNKGAKSPKNNSTPSEITSAVPSENSNPSEHEPKPNSADRSRATRSNSTQRKTELTLATLLLASAAIALPILLHRIRAVARKSDMPYSMFQTLA